MKSDSVHCWVRAALAGGALLIGAGAAAAEPASDMFDIAFGVAATSDYISRGITQTDHKAAIQGYIEPSYGMFYAGAWASNVSFSGDKDTEVDAYVGIRPEFGPVSLDLGYTHAFYINAPDDDSGELFAKVDFSPTDSVTVGGQFFINPDDSATYAEANGDIVLPHGFGVSGALGFVNDGTTPYTTWNAGIYYMPVDWVKLDLRYTDTNLSTVDCATVSGGAGNECDSRVMVGLSIDTSLSALKAK